MRTSFHSARRRALLLLLLPLVAFGLGGAQAKYQLRIAVQAPERSVWGKTLKGLIAEVEKRTNGQVKLKAYYSGVQGDERTVLRKMRVGQLHGAALIGQGVVDICPASLALNLPLLFENEEEVGFVLERMRPVLDKQCREKGYEALSWPQLGFSYLFSKGEIRGLDAFRRSRPWLVENDPLGQHFYEVLKVTPVSTGVSNVLTGLQSGLIRTVFAPPLALIAMQWHSRVRYRVDLKITYSFGVFVIAKKRWDRLPKNIRDVLRALFEKRNSELNMKIRKQNLDALEVIKKHGVETISPDPEGRAVFVRATEEVGRRMVGKYFSQEILDRVLNLLREYRGKNRKR